MFLAQPFSPDTNPPAYRVLRKANERAESIAQSLVGNIRRELSDEELEAHIKSCGELFKQAWARWEESSCFTDRGDAERWLMLQTEAIKARSRAMVARMERERGLA